MRKPGSLVVSDLLTEVPSLIPDLGLSTEGPLVRDGSLVPNPGPGVSASGRAIPGQTACRSAGT